MEPAKRKDQAKNPLPLSAGDNNTKQRNVSECRVDAIGGDDRSVHVNGAIGLADQAFSSGPKFNTLQQENRQSG